MNLKCKYNPILWAVKRVSCKDIRVRYTSLLRFYVGLRPRLTVPVLLYLEVYPQLFKREKLEKSSWICRFYLV